MTERSEVPISDALLAPLLEAAGDALVAMDAADVSPALLHLHGLDRRGLSRGPAPRQLRRSIDTDERFRDRVVGGFLARQEVSAVLSAWSAEEAVAQADAAAARGDLPLLVSALWAARPYGFAFGIGAAASAAARREREWGDDSDALAPAMRVDEAEEGRRRAEAAVVAARADVERLEALLREERRSRRAREEQAASDAEDARMKTAAVESELATALKEVRRFEARHQREAARAHDLEEELEALRRSLVAARKEAAAVHEQQSSHQDESDAASDGALLGARATSGEPGEPGGLGVSGVSGGPGESGGERAGVARPLGLVADSAEAVAAMVSNPGAALVIDGYNLTKRVWADSARSEQRSRLAMALAQAHLRGWCDVTVVFDGDATRRVAPLCRPGLRVLFSAAGERAGEVVVREAERLPNDVSVLVASSDEWVREHAESAGARVVSAGAVLLALGVGAAHL